VFQITNRSDAFNVGRACIVAYTQLEELTAAGRKTPVSQKWNC